MLWCTYKLDGRRYVLSRILDQRAELTNPITSETVSCPLSDIIGVEPRFNPTIPNVQPFHLRSRSFLTELRGHREVYIVSQIKQRKPRQPKDPNKPTTRRRSASTGTGRSPRRKLDVAAETARIVAEALAKAQRLQQ